MEYETIFRQFLTKGFIKYLPNMEYFVCPTFQTSLLSSRRFLIIYFLNIYSWVISLCSLLIHALLHLFLYLVTLHFLLDGLVALGFSLRGCLFATPEHSSRRFGSLMFEKPASVLRGGQAASQGGPAQKIDKLALMRDDWVKEGRECVCEDEVGMGRNTKRYCPLHSETHTTGETTNILFVDSPLKDWTKTS